jgi:hypothetical protein
MITGLSMYGLLLSLFVLVPAKSFILGKLNGDQVVGTLLLAFIFVPICMGLIHVGAKNLKLLKRNIAIPLLIAPFCLTIVYCIAWAIFA